VDDWVESIVISLPKKGDLTDPGNYLGILLMSTCLKIVCVILSDRINTTADAACRFSPSQVGFCQLEECITHATCLVEAIQQRRLAGLPTFGLFIDLKKAYNMVPHEAVFAKMWHFCIRGRCYNFIIVLYKRSTIHVCLGHGTGHSPAFSSTSSLMICLTISSTPGPAGVLPPTRSPPWTAPASLSLTLLRATSLSTSSIGMPSPCP
jgi:hypothetical protein